MLRLSLTERLLNYSHYVVVAGLVTLSVGGLTYISLGCGEIVMKHRKYKATQQSEPKN